MTTQEKIKMKEKEKEKVNQRRLQMINIKNQQSDTKYMSAELTNELSKSIILESRHLCSSTNTLNQLNVVENDLSNFSNSFFEDVHKEITNKFNFKHD